VLETTGITGLGGDPAEAAPDFAWERRFRGLKACRMTKTAIGPWLFLISAFEMGK